MTQKKELKIADDVMKQLNTQFSGQQKKRTTFQLTNPLDFNLHMLIFGFVLDCSFSRTKFAKRISMYFVKNIYEYCVYVYLCVCICNFVVGFF